MKTWQRKPLTLEPFQGGAPVSQWTPEQIRLGGAWAKHEIQHRTDELCAPYDWVPMWTTLDTDEIFAGVQLYYANR